MTYYERLKKMFHGVDFSVDDLYVLESFQIATLKERVPEKEFAAILYANPEIKTFLIKKYPPIGEFIKKVQDEYGPALNPIELAEYNDKLIWEIAEMIVYQKFPHIYDSRAVFGWDYKDITSVTNLKDKVVIDAGAGTGRVAFQAVQDARTIFAVEPCSSLRSFIRKKALKNNITNLFAIDGFLNEIPLPKDFADVLITSNAIGWRLEDELIEIERVVKTGGHIIHLTCSPNSDDGLKQRLTKPEFQYHFSENAVNGEIIRKYWKQVG